ncbi:MAG: hypothetical protein JNM27_10210 [Leptospirales bacterium]|nr:hypothetical protein [Leptospirales bacterium]
MPGLFYRFAADGRLELLGKPALHGSPGWDAIAEELRLEWNIQQAQKARTVQPAIPEEQMELFGNSGLKSLQTRMEKIPVLKPEKKKSA